MIWQKKEEKIRLKWKSSVLKNSKAVTALFYIKKSLFSKLFL